MFALPDPGSAGDARTVTVPRPLLLVDDDEHSARATEARLVRAGYLVATETRGDAVLKLVRTLFMPLVVTELDIPCADGPCLATVLGRERHRFPRLRVVVLTRHGGPADIVRAIAARCDAICAPGWPGASIVASLRRLDDRARRTPSRGAP
jgi:two-component system C4-dicarboxylate transport response regulator DctD